jgi:hypothetical protein
MARLLGVVQGGLFSSVEFVLVIPCSRSFRVLGHDFTDTITRLRLAEQRYGYRCIRQT